MVRLGSLLLVEERLLEACYFIDRMEDAGLGLEVGYDLNAFLSASRAVTFLLQKEMSAVPAFAEWWVGRQQAMRTDSAMRFFVDLRNFSQKEGRVSFASFGTGLDKNSYRHVFRDGSMVVPREIGMMDAIDACRLHLAKIARIVLECMDAFPFYTCPRQALSADGINARNIDLDEIDSCLGYTHGYSRIFDDPELRIYFLARHFDAVDRDSIEELAGLQATRPLHRSMSVDLSKELIEELKRRSDSYWSAVESEHGGDDP